MAELTTFSAQAVAAIRCRQIEATVERIRTLTNSSALEFSVAVGAVVVNEFYAGNLERWRVRRTKDASLRRLATHPQLPISAATLYRSIAIYELSVAVGGLERWPHVGPSQLRAVLMLPRHEQVRLLDAAEAGRWSAQLVRQHAASVSRSRKKGGRLAMPAPVKAVRTAARVVRSCAAVVADRNTLHALDEGAKNVIRDELHGIRRHLELLCQTLDPMA